MPLFTLAILLLIGSYIAWTSIDDALYLKNNPTHTYNVTLRNKLDQGYIWIDDNVRVLIWEEGADASNNPVHIITNGKIALNYIRTGSGYLLTLPLFAGLHRPPIMRTFSLAAEPRTSVARTSWG